MPSLRRGLRSGDTGDGAPLRETHGPFPSVWNTEFWCNADTEDVDLDDGDLAEGFHHTTIAPQIVGSDEQTITREEFYRLRYGESPP